VEGLYVGPSLGLGLGLGYNESVRGFEEEERVPAREEGSGDRHGVNRVGKPKWEREDSFRGMVLIKHLLTRKFRIMLITFYTQLSIHIFRFYYYYKCIYIY